METVILMLLVALSDKNESMKDSLNKFLCFYKENRELIKMLADTFSIPSSTPSQGATAQNERAEHKESRPREEVGDPSILEEYLRRVNA